MGDTTDGSSIAAHSAHDEKAEPTRKGFWNRMFGHPPKSPQPELESVADTNAMLLNIANMRDMRVDDVAIPTADITAVPDDSTLEELVASFRESTNTRLPVYNETLDNPLGLIHLKDLTLKHGFGSDEAFDLHAIIRPLIYVPPSMPLGVLLQKMQAAHIHMALVIDEYGGVEGLVTFEDLIEEIVGEIEDEHDVEEARLWSEESPSVYIAQARMPLDEFEEMAGVDLLPDDLDEDVDSLGGLVFMLSGRIPARGECIRDAHGHEFEVIDADARRIKRLRVRLKTGATTSQAAE